MSAAAHRGLDGQLTTDEQRLPAGPLIEKLVSEYGSIAALGRAAARQLHRFRHEGLSLTQADRWAVRFGWHPAEVWGQAWWSLD